MVCGEKGFSRMISPLEETILVILTGMVLTHKLAWHSPPYGISRVSAIPIYTLLSAIHLNWALANVRLG